VVLLIAFLLMGTSWSSSPGTPAPGGGPGPRTRAPAS